MTRSVPTVLKTEPPPRLLLKAKEAATALAISPRKLWEITNTGEVRCVRIGKSVRYAVDDLREFIADQA